MLENKKSYIMVKLVKVEPMTRAEFNSTHVCFNAEKKNLSEVGYSVVCDGAAQFLTKEQFNKYCLEVNDMKFSSAVQWLEIGFAVARRDWKAECIKLSKDGLHLVDNNNNKFYPSLCDIAANDWQIVE